MHKLSIAFFVLVFSLSLTVYAKSDSDSDDLKLNVQTSAQINARSSGVEIENEDELEIEAEIEDGVLQIKTKGEQSASSSSSRDLDDSDEDSSRSSSSSDSDVSDDNSGRIKIDIRELRGLDDSQKQELMLSLKNSLQVRTGQELEHFAQGILLSDDSLSKVEIDDSGVKVAFHRPARFLGFIQIDLSGTASVSDDLKVKVKFPWYRFLFNLSDDDKAVSLSEAISAQVAANAALGNENQNRARILELLSLVLKGGVSAQNNTTVTATSSSSSNPSSSSSASKVATVKTYTLAQVKTHATVSSCWSAVNGKVYDLTSWIGKHPGGEAAIKSICGIDGSAAFTVQHGGQSRPVSELSGFLIGNLVQ